MQQLEEQIAHLARTVEDLNSVLGRSFVWSGINLAVVRLLWSGSVLNLFSLVWVGLF